MRHAIVATLLLTSFAHALSAQPAPSLTHARQLFDARNWDAARQQYTVLARTTPGDVTPLLYLGRIALAQNEVEEGIRQFEHCVALDDRNADCHAWLGNALGTAAQRANKFKLPFLAKRTKNEFDRAVELDPANIEGRSGKMQYYLYAPGFLGGSAEKAREQASEMEKHNRFRGALAYGLIADHEKNARESEAAYQRAITIAPDSTAGYYGLLNTYVRDKRWPDAFALLDRVLVRLPAEPSALLAMARVAYVSGEQLGKGEDAAKRWLANPPVDASQNTRATAHFRLGNLYEKTNRRDLARAEYEKASSLWPKNDDMKKALDGVR